MLKILVVEDDYDIHELLQNYLEHEGYQIVVAEDGEAAIDLFHQENPDLILLDIMLPKLDGYSVCKIIRQESDVPVIMLTALDNEQNQIKGFDLKVDDYITKPFSIPILIKKIEAVLRRTAFYGSNSKITYKDMVFDLEEYRVQIHDRTVDLTQREFELLKILLQNQGKILTRQMLLSRVWDYDFFGDDRIVDTHIKNLRKKLDVDYIETIRGVGYRIDYENKK